MSDAKSGGLVEWLLKKRTGGDDNDTGSESGGDDDDDDGSGGIKLRWVLLTVGGVGLFAKWMYDKLGARKAGKAAAVPAPAREVVAAPPDRPAPQVDQAAVSPAPAPRVVAAPPDRPAPQVDQAAAVPAPAPQAAAAAAAPRAVPVTQPLPDAVQRMVDVYLTAYNQKNPTAAITLPAYTDDDSVHILKSSIDSAVRVVLRNDKKYKKNDRIQPYERTVRNLLTNLKQICMMIQAKQTLTVGYIVAELRQSVEKPGIGQLGAVHNLNVNILPDDILQTMAGVLIASTIYTVDVLIASMVGQQICYRGEFLRYFEVQEDELEAGQNSMQKSWWNPFRV